MASGGPVGQVKIRNSTRSLQEWIEVSDWAAKVKIIKINHKRVPFENCNMEDKTKCAQRDDGNFKAEILEITKGNWAIKRIKLSPKYCSKELPDKLGIYIFYGSKDSGYDGYEFVPEVNHTYLK